MKQKLIKNYVKNIRDGKLTINQIPQSIRLKVEHLLKIKKEFL